MDSKDLTLTIVSTIALFSQASILLQGIEKYKYTDYFCVSVRVHVCVLVADKARVEIYEMRKPVTIYVVIRKLLNLNMYLCFTFLLFFFCYISPPPQNSGILQNSVELLYHLSLFFI